MILYEFVWIYIILALYYINNTLGCISFLRPIHGILFKAHLCSKPEMSSLEQLVCSEQDSAQWIMITPTPNILYLDIFSMYISEQIVNQQAFDQCSFGIRGVHRFCGLWWTQVMDSWPWIPQTSQNLRSLKFIVGHSEFRIPKSHLKYGGRNPAPVDRWLIPLFIGFQHVSTIQNWWCRISLVHPQ